MSVLMLLAMATIALIFSVYAKGERHTEAKRVLVLPVQEERGR